jgi:hypothetical protein
MENKILDPVLEKILSSQLKFNGYTLSSGRYQPASKKSLIYCKFANPQDKILFYLDPIYEYKGTKAIISNEHGLIYCSRITIEANDHSDYLTFTLWGTVSYQTREQVIADCEQSLNLNKTTNNFLGVQL